MKQKIFFDCTKEPTRDQLADMMVQASEQLREGNDIGRVIFGEKSWAQWRLYPPKNDEAHRAFIERWSMEGLQRAIAHD